jgi:hypothetical protein
MDVLGHDHVAHEREAHAVANFRKNLNEDIPGIARAQERQLAVATARNEVKISPSVASFQSCRHRKATQDPALEERQGRGTRKSYTATSS